MKWRKSSYSGDESDCVELGSRGRDFSAVRDSKNPDSGILVANIGALVQFAKTREL